MNAFTHSKTNWSDSSLHFSDGSENSFKIDFKICSRTSCQTLSDNGGFLLNNSLDIFSNALFLVALLSSERQLISLWIF